MRLNKYITKFLEKVSLGLFEEKEPTLNEMTIMEMINKYPHVTVHNEDSIRTSEAEGKEQHWLNPVNQECFNSGLYTVSDFREWANGFGPIVKGATKGDKAKIMEYAIFGARYDYRLLSYYEYLHLLDVKIPQFNWGSSGRGTKVENAGVKIKDNVNVTAELLASNLATLKSDMDGAWDLSYGDDKVNGKYLKGVNENWHKEFYGIKWTMMLLGLGYFGACNIPQAIDNFAWSEDLVWAKAYHDHLVGRGVTIPDITWVKENIYKF